MSYTYLTIEERSKIEVLVQEGYKINHIANLLGRHRSTIYRELNRCSTPSYVAKASQADANQLASHKGRKAKHTPKLLEDIQHKLEMTWSPEQIVGRDYQEKLSFKTIYNWIYEGILNVPLQVLRNKGKGRQPQETRGKFNIGRSISKRPKSVRNRQEFGHWELDTMVSSRGKSKGCLATFAERKSRLYLAFLIPNRTKDAMHNAIEQLTSNLPDHALKSFTSDRGKEFACYPDVEASGIDFYFADAYSAWQRGTNENSNGLMREFFPKKTDLAKVSETELFTALWLMNNRPRKCLNYQTPLEKFMHETSLIELRKKCRNNYCNSSYIKEDLDLNWYTYFRLLAYSGARKSELVALKLSDIDFDTSTLNISKTLTRGLNNKIIMQPTKTVNGRRVIDMDYDSMKLLKLWKMYQAQFMLKLGFNTNTHDQNVFANTRNNFYSINVPNDRMRNVQKRNGLK